MNRACLFGALVLLSGPVMADTFCTLLEGAFVGKDRAAVANVAELVRQGKTHEGWEYSVSHHVARTVFDTFPIVVERRDNDMILFHADAAGKIHNWTEAESVRCP